ncbi:Protein-lysine methyltransferase METTL21D [Bienertia sinuspersici]
MKSWNHTGSFTYLLWLSYMAAKLTASKLLDFGIDVSMESDRLNLPDTSVVTIDLMGHQLQFSQDPNSKHLGTTVWDASMVFAKYLERNSRKGKFCPSKLKRKRVIELGAGCGVASFGMAMLGCEVVTTDQKEVLPLLQRNVKRNISWIMQGNANSDSFGSIKVAELDWGNKDHIQAVDPPYDIVIGTDVVYSEHLLDPLLQTIHDLSGPRTTIVLGYEIRSTSVHEKMLQMWKSNFDVKTVPRTKMDRKYQHPSIQLYIMEPKSSAGISLAADQDKDQASESKDRKSDQREEKTSVICEVVGEKDNRDCSAATGLSSRDLTDWEVRRCGAMAARLLRDVKID